MPRKKLEEKVKCPHSNCTTTFSYTGSKIRHLKNYHKNPCSNDSNCQECISPPPKITKTIFVNHWENKETKGTRIKCRHVDCSLKFVEKYISRHERKHTVCSSSCEKCYDNEKLDNGRKDKDIKDLVHLKKEFNIPDLKWVCFLDSAGFDRKKYCLSQIKKNS